MGENMFAVYLLVARNILIVAMAFIGLIWFGVEVALTSKIERADVQQRQAPSSPVDGAAASAEAKPVFRRRRGRHALAS